MVGPAPTAVKKKEGGGEKTSNGYQVGVERTSITPPWGVELAGLGYYLERAWERVRDGLNATAFVVSDNMAHSAAIVALDLMYNDRDFTQEIRKQVARFTDIPPYAVCVNVSHSHSAPTAGFIRGAGEQDAEYLRWVARQAATAVILAWRNRQPARIYCGSAELAGFTFNRTCKGGLVDQHLSVLRADSISVAHPFAVLVNFHAHPCVHLETDFRAISRDLPGEVVNQLEAALPGATVLYLEGSCGDVNFRRDFLSTGKRYEPARAIAGLALHILASARPIDSEGITAVTVPITLPTRRWTLDEVRQEHKEGIYRLKTHDPTGWLQGIGRVVVNEPERLPQRYGGSVGGAVAAVARFAVEWTEEVLPKLDRLPEDLSTEVQAIRLGDVYFAAHGSELFSSFSLQLRQSWPHDDLFVLGYSNDSIGYMPDGYDIARRSYAAVTSPKCVGHFPFTDHSGQALVRCLVDALART